MKSYIQWLKDRELELAKEIAAHPLFQELEKVRSLISEEEISAPVPMQPPTTKDPSAPTTTTILLECAKDLITRLGRPVTAGDVREELLATGVFVFGRDDTKIKNIPPLLNDATRRRDKIGLKKVGKGLFDIRTEEELQQMTLQE